MTPEELIKSAVTTTGLDDFGDEALFGGESWRVGLDVLVDALDREARLHDIGQMVVTGELTRYLINRLRIVDHHRKHPEIRERDITPPVVIMGQARTGTTLLFDLLAQDSDHRVPLTWEVDEPLPPPRTATYLIDPRIAAAEETFALVDGMIPEFRSVHQLGAQLAQECVRITGSHFVSVIFATQYHVPSYLDWLLHAAQQRGLMANAYTWHRRCLELLQSEAPGRRWLLKSPFHCWTLPELMAEYPGALLVQTHRDPARIMGSITSLIATLRKLGTSENDPSVIAADFAELVLDGLDRTVAARESGLIAPGAAVDVMFDEVASDPLGVVRRVYDAFGWELTVNTERAMETFHRDNLRETGGHDYRFADTGLDLDQVRARTARYCSYFDVPEEKIR